MRDLPDSLPDQPEPEPRRARLLQALWPVLVMAGLGLAIFGLVRAFPYVAAYMARQDCIATGHVNC